MKTGEKFNPKPLLTKASNLFGKQEASKTGKWNLGWSQGTFFLLPAETKVAPEIVLMRLTELDLIKGLTTRQWNQLEAKICSLHKQGVIECPH